MERLCVVYTSDAARGAVWHRVFREEAPDLALIDWSPGADCADARYIVGWTPPERVEEVLPKAEIFFCIGAGVDHLPFLPPGLRLVRMVDPDLTRSMVDYVAWAVLAQQRDIPFYLAEQRAGRWSPLPVRRAADTHVGIMGLGALGQACAEALRDGGYRVRGWSASRKSIAGIESFAGRGELSAFCAGLDSLVCLLPLTQDTRGILNAALFAMLPRGAGLINVGRGGHLAEDDLLKALEDGRIGSAILDVLAQEPPPEGHPLFAHPRVLVTPHRASFTQPESAARQVIRGILQHRAGLAIDHEVDRRQGY